MSKTEQKELAVCQNRKALFRYEILERLECGIELRGSEVKSMRARAASIDEAYALVDKDELWLIGSHIAPYANSPVTSHDAHRDRKLLVHKSELRKLRLRIEQKGLTLIPLRLYFNERGIAKITLAVARGKTVSDKRETLKAKEHQREMNRFTRGKPR